MQQEPNWYAVVIGPRFCTPNTSFSVNRRHQSKRGACFRLTLPEYSVTECHHLNVFVTRYARRAVWAIADAWGLLTRPLGHACCRLTGCCAGAKAGIPGWSPPGVWRRSSCLASSSHTCSWASPWPWVPRCSSHGWASSALPGRSTSRSRCLPGIESADRRGLWSLRLRLKSLRVALIRRHKNVHERLVTVAGTRLRRVCALRPQIWSLDLCASTL